MGGGVGEILWGLGDGEGSGGMGRSLTLGDLGGLGWFGGLGDLDGFGEGLEGPGVGTAGKENGLKVWDLERPGEPLFRAKNERWLGPRMPYWDRDLQFLPGSQRVVTCTGHGQVRGHLGSLWGHLGSAGFIRGHLQRATASPGDSGSSGVSGVTLGSFGSNLQRAMEGSKGGGFPPQAGHLGRGGSCGVNGVTLRSFRVSGSLHGPRTGQGSSGVRGVI
uniref:Uncharacterized protein n=1 Tax=Malurus cyaneus samueli TaxID=2593467 RepID=A0A8C5TIW8_9PASS